MSKVLYIQASPRVGRSHSIAVADAFIASYRESHRGDEIAKLNLFEARLPAFDGLRLQAKYSILHGQKPSPEELEAWKEIEAIIADFKSADKYVIAAPMWNFSLPYRLKQYLDILIQPTYTFSYTPAEGYKGLVANRPVFVAYARGGEYPAGSASEALDFQKRYLEMALGFIGLTDIRSVIVEPTLMGADIAAAKRSAAIAQARQMARSF